MVLAMSTTSNDSQSSINANSSRQHCADRSVVASWAARKRPSSSAQRSGDDHLTPGQLISEAAVSLTLADNARNQSGEENKMAEHELQGSRGSIHPSHSSSLFNIFDCTPSKSLTFRNANVDLRDNVLWRRSPPEKVLRIQKGKCIQNLDPCAVDNGVAMHQQVNLIDSVPASPTGAKHLQTRAVVKRRRLLQCNENSTPQWQSLAAETLQLKTLLSKQLSTKSLTRRRPHSISDISRERARHHSPQEEGSDDNLPVSPTIASRRARLTLQKSSSANSVDELLCGLRNSMPVPPIFNLATVNSGVPVISQRPIPLPTLVSQIPIGVATTTYSTSPVKLQAAASINAPTHDNNAVSFLSVLSGAINGIASNTKLTTDSYSLRRGVTVAVKGSEYHADISTSLASSFVGGSKPHRSPTMLALSDDAFFEVHDKDDTFFEAQDDDDAFWAETIMAVDDVVMQKQQAPISMHSLSSTINPRKKTYVRLSVIRVDYTTEQINQKVVRQAVLALCDDLFKESTAILRDQWLNGLTVQPGDIVHVIGIFDEHHRIIIDSNKNFLIQFPDILVSGTAAADAPECVRKVVLNGRIRAAGETSLPMVHGIILHQLVQTCLEQGNFTTSFIESALKQVVAQQLEQLYTIGQSEQEAITQLLEHTQTIMSWADRHVGQAIFRNNQSSTMVKLPYGRKTESSVCFNKLIDIEESIWSPKYGLRGIVDATVQTIVGKGTRNVQTHIAPLEIKTSKKAGWSGHRAQTALYVLLLSDRYQIDVRAGYLYYLRLGEMTPIPFVHHEMRDLILARNTLAGYLHARTTLPPMLRNARTCQQCFSLDTCLLYHKATESGTADSSALGALFEQKTGHLSDDHLAFFTKWERLLTLEESQVTRLRHEIWTIPSQTREQYGRCLSRMRVIECVRTESRQCEYTFTRAFPNGNSILGSAISTGDLIVVSSEDGHYGLATGFVKAIDQEHLVVTLDRQLRIPSAVTALSNQIDNLPLESKREVRSRHNLPFGSNQFIENKENKQEMSMFFRIDKDEQSSNMNTARYNLVCLFNDGNSSGTTSCQRLRELVVDLVMPVFERDRLTTWKLWPDIVKGLNPGQSKAIEMVLTAEDYAMILGMPGTGKTTTIACIIQALVADGKSVLLTSYTHTAVDNVLLKLVEANVEFVRLGVTEKIHPKIRDYTPNFTDDLKSVADYTTYYASKLVVATTCLSIGHPAILQRRFDYCIVDEASQIMLPVCIGPLRFANTFVFVGDHYQLPPLVQHPAAKELSTSLFKRLSEAYPNALTSLEYQYRMNEDIMLLSNTLVYNHKLRCGTLSIANSTLSLPIGLDALSKIIHKSSSIVEGKTILSSTQCFINSCWITEILEPNRRVVFLNTDQLPAPEIRSDNSVCNQVEADLAYQIIRAMMIAGVSPHDTGLVTPYRAQLKLLVRLLNGQGNFGDGRPTLVNSKSSISSSITSSPTDPIAAMLKQIEAHTVDKFQGRDKECIIISMVRNNESGTVGELLRDWRRLNVAFTRAKRKLIIIGSRQILGHALLLRQFLTLIEQQGWLYTLPASAHIIPHAQVNAQPGLTIPRHANETISKRLSPTVPVVRRPLQAIVGTRANVHHGIPVRKCSLTANDNAKQQKASLIAEWTSGEDNSAH